MAVAVADSWFAEDTGDTPTAVAVSGFQAGDVAVVICFSFSNVTTATHDVPTDDAGNSYTDRTENPRTATFRSICSVSDAVIETPPTSVTFNINGATGVAQSIVVLRLTGVDSLHPHVASDERTVTSDDPSSDTIATRNGGLAIGAICYDGDAITLAASGWTTAEEVETSAAQAFSVVTKATTGADETTAWQTGSSADYAIVIAAYRAESAEGLNWAASVSSESDETPTLGGVAAGSLIILTQGFGGVASAPTPYPPTDNQGNNYQLIERIEDALNDQVSVWWWVAAKNSGSLTVTFDGGLGFESFSVTEYERNGEGVISNDDFSGVLRTGMGAGTDAYISDSVVALRDSLLVGFSQNTNDTNDISPGTGFTERFETANAANQLQDKQVAAGTHTATWTDPFSGRRLLGAATFSIAPTGTRIQNNSFEVDTSEWSGYNAATLSRTNEVTASLGSWQAKAVTTGAAVDYGIQSEDEVVAPNPPLNAIYRGRGSLRGIAATVGDLVLVTMQERGGGAGNQNGNSEDVTLTTAYQRSSWSVRRVAQDDRTTMVLFFIATANAGGDALYLDDVYFDRVDNLPLESAVLAAHPGIVSYYKMDDPNDANNALIDLIGGNHGIYSSTVSMLQSPLVNDGYHSAAFHNALGDAAVVGTPVHRFDGNAAFTVCGWFQLNAFNGGSGHWGVNCLSVANGWDIHMNANNAVTFFRQGVGIDYTHGSSLVGQKFFAAIRYDGTTLYGNFEGVDITPQPSTDPIPTHSANFAIGAYSEGGSGWDGPIDEIIVFDDDIGEAACLAIKEAGAFVEEEPEPSGTIILPMRMI